MKKFAIALLLFSATGVSFGMKQEAPKEPMNTMPGTNPKLTQYQYNQVKNKKVHVEKMMNNFYDQIDKVNEEIARGILDLETLPRPSDPRKPIEKKLNEYEEYKKKLNKVLIGIPYKSYSDAEIQQLIDSAPWPHMKQNYWDV